LLSLTLMSVKLILVCFSTMLECVCKKCGYIEFPETVFIYLPNRTREAQVTVSEGQVCVFGLDGNLGAHRQESDRQSTCITMQTVGLSGKRLLCSERIHTYVLMVQSCRLLPLGAGLHLGSSPSLPKNFRTTQDRSFSSLLKSY